MYRGSHPTSGADREPSPPPAGMLALDMNRLPSIPSRPAPPPPFSAYGPGTYQRHAVAPSQPDMYSSSQHHRPRDPDGTQSNAQQLPSLRTLLEPELLDSKLLDPPLRLGGAQFAHGSSVRYGSSSPTLKRRHDFDGYSHDHPEHNAIVSRAPLAPSNAHNTTILNGQPLSYSIPGSVTGPRPLESSRHVRLGPSLHTDGVVKTYRPASTPSAMSDSVGHFAGQSMNDDPMDIVKPTRRRTEGSSRAPVRSSRCVGQQDIPGEGLCYIYEDGTYCRAVIDGEQVNPNWGVTKAGKPRKRLAQACLTCREKKIKCEPGYPKCHQCAKSQRACRGGLNQLGMSNASGETSPSSSSVLFKSQSTELVSPVAGHDKSRIPEEHRDPSRTVEAWNASSSIFRPRTFRPTSATTSRDMSVHSADSDYSSSMNPDPDDPRRGSHQDQLGIQWEQDPYETDPRLTMHLLDLYFSHAGRAAHGMFPRKPFLTWVETKHDKNQDHLMLLYSALAMGSVFSEDQDHRALGNRFATIAAYATEKRFGKFTLQLCQSRLLLALYKFALGKAQEAWDFCGAGLRALSALKLNTEEGVRELVEASAELDYGLDRKMFEECCRRTFWSGFLMDRYNGFCGGTLSVINTEDIFVNLPCAENMYEASTPMDTPLFDLALLSQHTMAGASLGHMAQLILISALWGDVLTFTSRARHRPDMGYERAYEIFYAQTNERLDAWNNMLPANLRFNQQNLNQSIAGGYSGIFISLHALYYATIIRLNRHVRIQAVLPDKVRRNLARSFQAAANFMVLVNLLTAADRQGMVAPHPGSRFLFSTPFPGYALMLSVDVFSSAGTTSNLSRCIETIESTVSFIETMGNFWVSAIAQKMSVLGRLQQLRELKRQEEENVQNGHYEQFWRLRESLEGAFGDTDAVYKPTDQIVFEVVGGLA